MKRRNKPPPVFSHPAAENIRFLKEIEKSLSGYGVMSPRYEAEGIVLHHGRMSRLECFAGFKRLNGHQKKRIVDTVKKRASRIPMAYLLGQCYFYGKKFIVNRHTLIPRHETEILVEEALGVLNREYPLDANSDSGPSVLDLCTGSGIIAICLTTSRCDCKMTALDISENALDVARKNLKLHNLEKKVKLIKSDLFQCFRRKEKPIWDIIVCNPPYISKAEINGLSPEVKKEPPIALEAGAEGLDVINKILAEAPPFLKKTGWLLMEIGQGQDRSIRERISLDRRWRLVRIFKDMNGIDRILAFKRM